MTTAEERKGIAPWLRGAVGFFVFVLVLMLYPYTGDPASIPKGLVLHWFVFAALAVWLAWSWYAGGKLAKPPVFFYPLLILLGLHALSALTSSFPAYSFTFVRRLLMLMFLYVLVAQIYRTPRQMARLMLAFCAAMAVASIYGFLQRFGLDPFPWADRSLEEYRNMPATFGNPNFAGHALVLAIICAVYLGLSSRRRWYCWGFAVLFLVHLRISQTRASALALVAAVTLTVLAVLIGRTTWSVRRKTVAVALALVAFGGVGLTAGCLLLEARTGTPYPLDTSILLRYNGYYGGSTMVTDRPVLGYGPGVYELENIRYWSPFEQWWFASKRQLNEHVHNNLIEMSIDSGVAAAVLYLGLFLLGIVHGLCAYFTGRSPERRKLGLMLAAFFLAFFVDGLFGFNFRVPVSASMLFIALGFVDGEYLAQLPSPQPRGRMGWAFAWLCAVIVLGGASALAMTRQFNAERYLQQGRGAMSDVHNAFQPAHTLFLKGANYSPWDWRFPLHAGLASMHLDRYSDAVTELREALRLRPDYITTLVSLAQAEREAALSSTISLESKLELLDEGRAHAERVAVLCPGFWEAPEVLGRIAATKALEMTQAHAAAEEVQAAWTAAEAWFRQALDAGAPDRARVLLMLSRTLTARKQFDEAERALQEAAGLNPGGLDIWQAYSELAEKGDRFVGLSRLLEREIAVALRAPAPDPELLSMLHLWHAYVAGAKLNSHDAALRSYIAAAEYRPGRASVWNDFAVYATGQNYVPQFKAALLGVTAAAAKKGEPVSPAAAALAKAWGNGVEGLREGVRMLAQAVENGAFDTDTTPLDAQMGWAARFLLDEFAAHRENMGPVAPAAWQLSGVFMELEAYTAAEQLLKAALPYLPPETIAPAARSLVDALQKQDRPGEALGVLRQAARKAPQDIDLRVSLARALAASGKHAEARIEYMMILQTPNLTNEGRQVIQDELAKLQQH